MSNIRGIGSDRTTFNEKQEVGAFRIGILNKNQELRNIILKRNIGRYEKYDKIMTPAIGEVENIYYNENKFPTIVGDLLEYTHGYSSNKTELRKLLDNRYGDIFTHYYYTKPTFNGEALPWRGQYTNYVDYMGTVHGIDGYRDGKFTLGDAYDAIVDILKYDDASFMAKDMAVGVVRNINVPIAMSGVITTNVANMSGMDTKLGIITNAMYSNTLYNASLVNDSRKRQYITPELESYVGNTWKTVGSLSDLFPILKTNGRTGDAFDGSNFIEECDKVEDKKAWDSWNKAIDNNESIYSVENLQGAFRFEHLMGSMYNFQNRNTSEIYSKNKFFYGPYRTSYSTDLKRGVSVNTIGKSFLKIGSTMGGRSIWGGGAELGTGVYDDDGNEITVVGPPSELISNKNIQGYVEQGIIDFDEIGKNIHGNTYTSLTWGVRSDTENENDLLAKTNKLFNEGKIKSLIGRYRNPEDTEVSLTQTAVSNFGVSRGRNLLRNNAVIGSNKNPYCRVWTMFHQYNEYEDAIRGKGNFTITKQQDALESYGQRVKKGWQVNSVLNDNGTVKIAPHKDGTFQDVFTKSKAETGTTRGYIKTSGDIHKYMFSIENLAWKDSDQFIDNLTPSQRGPNGGRIMWFPPYDLEFTENITPEWEPHSFIGRGEQIYTYKNTTRSGTLSFTMLIDHPSMVDLWAHEDGDKTTDGDEMDILRYFAGCGDLPINIKLEDEITECTIADDTDNSSSDNSLNTQPLSDTEKEPNIEETPIVSNKGSLEFYVFFPNNFSGKEFYNGKVSLKDNVTLEYADPPKGAFSYEQDALAMEPISYIVKGDRTILPEIYEPGTTGNGYEITAGSPLGNAQEYKVVVLKNGEKIKRVPNPTEVISEENYVVWHYRVDTDVADQILVYTDNYQDRESYGLNGNVEKLKTYAKSIMKNPNPEEGSNVYVLTLKDIWDIIYDKPVSGDVATIKEILLNKETKISQAEIKGFASSHGNIENNNKLAIERGRTVYRWLKGSGIFSSILPDDLIIDSEVTTVDKTDLKTVNGPSAKVARSVRVYIEFESVPTKAENNQTETEEEFNASKNEVTDPNAPKLNNAENDVQISDGDFFPANVTRSYSQEEGNEVLIPVGGGYWEDENQNLYLWNEETKIFELHTVISKEESMLDASTCIADIEKKVEKPKCVTKTIRKPFKDVALAQNEYKYFEDIARQKTPLFYKISEKIKYFDPAFHSLTPEGFNARLNFLHQCTRQGPTCGASDTKGFSAGNLSFGRPPFCVLRVGDFYHTKILIDSISINYGERQWDLNPEGAGVQPMMAKIDINFTFLGGSDLGGPINRLQNAVSFNYYANTGVYDDRAMLYVKQEYEEAMEKVFTHDDGSEIWEHVLDSDDNQLYKRK